MKFEHTSGGFTLPGESGQEKLTLELAEKWGADVIRDSDGTKLSDEILDAGYDIYSTLCIIRDHNEWAKQHPECLQQSFLSTDPVIAAEGPLTVRPMAGFFAEQFRINDRPEAMRYWQVWDRTADKPLPAGAWRWDASAGTVTVAEPVPFHAYTVSFLAWRLWEEINMYNHVTNHWTSEHLLPVDPRTAEAQDYLYSWLQTWCESHPQTNVVRFTSMFYNFVWIWGSDDRNRNLFTDWGSYDFTVSEKALDDFAAAYGYALTAEDFINKGSLQVTHMPPTAHKRDYMEFTQQFVAGFGKKLVDLVHHYGKRAYVFYDDSWVGVEPYGPHFKEFGFDGIIKCVFSGYEARMCAGVDAPVHELRFHPYLFPVGLGGAPTFAPGGNPTHDAAAYWNHVRRALLRAKIDRIGLGGYLHLLNDFPDFVDYIAAISDEFRAIKALHTRGSVATLPLTVAVLHSWGSLRPWTLSGHFHETYMHTLIHINEALAGLPVNVKFINFDDVKNGVPDDVDVIINAGRAGSAWSGGDAWQDETLVAALNKWVYNGGVLLGVEEPSAVSGYGDTFRMARILGVDEDTPIDAKILSNAVENAQKSVESRNFRARKNVLEYDNVMNTQREVIYAQRQKVLDGEDLRENMMQMLRSLVESDVSTALSGHGGEVNEDGLKGLANAMEGIYFAKGTLASRREQLLAMSADQLTDTIFEIAQHTYEAKEAAYTPKIMRELERVVMLRVVDEYWMDNIDAMDDLKQGIGLRAYGQHDPVVAYKEEGYQMFEAMITAIKEETIRRMFLVQLRPAQEVKREKVAKETGTSAPDKSQVKRAPVRKEHKVGPNDPCPCGSGKKYKKCCMQKDKLES